MKGPEREDSSKQKDQPKEGESSERKKDDVAGENKGLRITVIRVEINRDDADKHYHEGTRLYNSRRYEEAIEEYDKALAIDPNDKVVHYNKGLSLYYLHRYKEAIEEFDKALAIDPDYKNARISRELALNEVRKAGTLGFQVRSYATCRRSTRALKPKTS